MAKNQEFIMITKGTKVYKEFRFCQADGCDQETASYASPSSRGSKKYCKAHAKVAAAAWKNLISEQAAEREALRQGTLALIKPYVKASGTAYRTIRGRSTLANDAIKDGCGVKVGDSVVVHLDLGKNPWQVLSEINAGLSLLGVKDGLIM